MAVLRPWSSTNWPGAPGTADTTVWQYDEASGLLTNKVYADENNVAYAYTADGKLTHRTWARGQSTAYEYDNTGALTNIDYQATNTPDISFTYDRLGRQVTVTDGLGTRTFTYSPALQLTNETVITGAAPDGRGATNVITRLYDELGRAAGFDLDSQFVVTNEYLNLFGRFKQVHCSIGGAPAYDAFYYYEMDSDLVKGYNISKVGDELLKTRRFFETNRDLFTAVSNDVDGTLISQYGYQNDALGRRTSMTQTGKSFEFADAAKTYDLSAFWLYAYNDRGELTSGTRYFGTDTGQTGNPVAGQGWDYAFDNIGNRSTVTHNGQQTAYTANQLNQYTARQVLGEADIHGAASEDAVVTVNNQATTRQSAYYHKALALANTNAAAWENVSVVGVINPPGTIDPDIVTTVRRR